MKYIKECLDSLLRQTYKHIEIIFVDNGSIDDSVRYVEIHYPSVRVIALNKNQGFSGGVNQGIKHALGEYIMLLNTDTIVDEKCVEELREAMQNYPSAGFMASKMLFAGSERIINAAGDCMCDDGIARNIGFREIDNGQYKEPVEVFGACAGAAIYRRRIFEEVGLFDEDFFLIFEDVDWSFRAQIAGYKCMYIPTAIVYHLHGGSIDSTSPLSVFYFSKNDMNVLVKNMPLSLFLKYFYRIFKRQYYQSLSFILRNRASALLKGELKAFFQLPKMLARRFHIQERKRVITSYIDNIIMKH